MQSLKRTLCRVGDMASILRIDGDDLSLLLRRKEGKIKNDNVRRSVLNNIENMGELVETIHENVPQFREIRDNSRKSVYCLKLSTENLRKRR